MSAKVDRMTRAGRHWSLGRSTLAIAKIMRITEPEVVKLVDADRCYRRGLPLPEYEARK